MRPGRMDRRVVLQRQIEPQNEYGEVEPIWTDQMSVWAQVQPIRGSERFQAEGLQTEATTEFLLRYSPTVAAMTPKNWRIVYKEQHYDIEEVQELGRHDGVKILAVIREYNNTV